MDIFEEIALETSLESGTDRKWLEARFDLESVQALPPTTQSSGVPWTAAEEDFLRENLGVLHIDAIATALGRSRNAIKVHYTRYMPDVGMKGGESQPLTSRDVAEILGMRCGKSAGRLIERGHLKGHLLPTDQKIYGVHPWDLKRFAVNPMNWVYFDPDAVTDPKLKKLIALRKERWGDEWWTTGQAADYLGLVSTKQDGPSKLVNKRILEGKVKSAVKYGNWYLLKSEAMTLEITQGSGSNGVVYLSDNALRMLTLAWLIGLPRPYTAVLIGKQKKFIDYWVRWREKTGEMAELAERFFPESMATASMRPWLDYRPYIGRFHWLRKALRRYQCDEMRPGDNVAPSKLMEAWALAHWPEYARIKTLKYSNAATRRTLKACEGDLVKAGMGEVDCG